MSTGFLVDPSAEQPRVTDARNQVAGSPAKFYGSDISHTLEVRMRCGISKELRSVGP